MKIQESDIEIFSTCPQFTDFGEGYLERVRDVAKWSEECGCKGILIYADNRQVDPWTVAQVIIENTLSLCPLVAVQPVYMHPYTVAKKLVTIGEMYRRKIYLNMVAGGFKNDLTALNDETPHDRRYNRLVEYTTIIRELMTGEKPVTFIGEYYQVNNLSLTPKPDPEYFPGIFVSGSSQAGLEAAGALRATAIQYPDPPGEYHAYSNTGALDYGIRIGIVARSNDREAWNAGYQRFPESRQGELTHKLALKTTDSRWYKKMAGTEEPATRQRNGSPGVTQNGKPSARPVNRVPKGAATEIRSESSSYWLHPFKTYGSMCPYLVGSYRTVGKELARYLNIGYRTFILDIPQKKEDLIHTKRAFQNSLIKSAV